MIFPGGLIQPMVMNAHVQPGNSHNRNKLITLILDDHHSILFWNYLNWTYSFTTIDRVDDCSIKKFDNLLFYSLLHVRI